MGRITGEQSNVQHSLGDGLLGGVPVGVQLRLQTGRRTLFMILISLLDRELTLMIVFLFLFLSSVGI